jgi:hypothetical protein
MVEDGMLACCGCGGRAYWAPIVVRNWATEGNAANRTAPTGLTIRRDDGYAAEPKPIYENRTLVPLSSSAY